MAVIMTLTNQSGRSGACLTMTGILHAKRKRRLAPSAPHPHSQVVCAAPPAPTAPALSLCSVVLLPPYIHIYLPSLPPFPLHTLDSFLPTPSPQLPPHHQLGTYSSLFPIPVSSNTPSWPSRLAVVDRQHPQLTPPNDSSSTTTSSFSLFAFSSFTPSRHRLLHQSVQHSLILPVPPPITWPIATRFAHFTVTTDLKTPIALGT